MDSRISPYYTYSREGWIPKKHPVNWKDGEDTDDAYREAGYSQMVSVGADRYFEIWRLNKDNRDLPLFLVEISLIDSDVSVGINSIPALMAICQEVKSYISILTQEESCDV